MKHQKPAYARKATDGTTKPILVIPAQILLLCAMNAQIKYVLSANQITSCFLQTKNLVRTSYPGAKSQFQIKLGISSTRLEKSSEIMDFTLAPNAYLASTGNLSPTARENALSAATR